MTPASTSRAPTRRQPPSRLAEQPEPEQGGEERVAGEQQAAAPGAQPVHAGEEGGVADEDADEAGERQQGSGALGERLPAPGGEAGAGQHQADQEHAPAAAGKGPRWRAGLTEIRAATAHKLVGQRQPFVSP